MAFACQQVGTEVVGAEHGQSAGVVAALAARQGVDPRAVPIDAAKRQLRAIGAIVP